MEKTRNTNNKSKNKNMAKSQKGITLVALVITIIVIIILATVAINFAFGNNGLITQAEKARDFYTNDTKYTDDSMSNVESYIDGIISGGSGGDEPTPPTKSEVAEAIEDGTKFTDTTTIKDDLDNSVTIPGGFHLAEDSGTKVEDGIVIEDETENHNQFVWIPVGEYNVTEETEKITELDKQDGKLINELSRRRFSSSGASLVSGDSVVSSYYYGEGDSRSVAYNQIDAFKTSAMSYEGFYIGRYEQGTGNVCKSGVSPYVKVARDTAKSQAKKMYSGNTDIKATTELISSYAWDTALNFICQTNTAGYTLATTKNSSYGNIGTGSGGKTQTGEYKADNYSNIHDLLGNCEEWTTEYSSYSNGGKPQSCVIRGGKYSQSYTSVADRSSSNMATAGVIFVDDQGFRVQLYV